MLRFLVAIFALTFAAQSLSAAEPPTVRPVFHVDARNPTADKPQSKLWFARGTWWAWLPNAQGSSLWRRTDTGWNPQSGLDDSLRSLPGRADVVADGDQVHAVLVDDRSLAVVELRFDNNKAAYQLAGDPVRFEVTGGQTNENIETATIALDSRGTRWVAYPWKQRMWVRATLDKKGTRWTATIAVSETTDRDDLCAIVALPSAIGLAWSNQVDDSMNFRVHRDGATADDWAPVEVIERGRHNADDHINAKVAASGVLLLATKNSVDQVGEAQLVLRVRETTGQWQNIPYAPRTSTGQPSRPVVLLGGEPPQVLLLHTVYGPPDQASQERRNTIVWQAAPLAQLTAATLAARSQLGIDPDAAINNVTGCKAALPAGARWIFLASDEAGRVYEGCLDPAAIQDPTKAD